MSNLADLRKEYMQRGLDAAEMDPDPIRQFQAWFDAALAAEHPEPPDRAAVTTCRTAGAWASQW